MNFDQLFGSFNDIRVAVVGDVMLDTYWWGHVERISPEAPVPVVALDNRELRIGGAGNVALNLVALGAKVDIFTVMGDDEDGKMLDRLLAEAGIGTSQVVFSTDRKTTNKTRIISRNQQMMRLDSETTRDLDHHAETQLLQRISRYLKETKPAVLIFEDYNKGVLTENLITEVISDCRKQGVLTAVDPKKKNFFSYKGVDIFKPNLKEVREGLNIQLDHVTLDSMRSVHDQLQDKLDHRISFITLSEKGVFYQDNGQAAIIPSHLRNIADVSGAGDTVIAVAALVYAATGKVELFSEIANIAGGLVCEEVGTAAIRKEVLLSECKMLLS
jgi:rfaE bifunctional protein kinase chain/domain